MAMVPSGPKSPWNFRTGDDRRRAERLSDMAREKLPNGKHADFGVTVEDGAGRKCIQSE